MLTDILYPSLVSNIFVLILSIGFKIVEYLSEKYHNPDEEGLPGGEDFFRFEKIMR